ncbi:sugar transporter SWEET1-like [Babylonia areolata]|uniref:sugar transporter SWEET1-like n=1 Tax=Babylonia areolata TaxID=304850 RepID=UPI003FD4ADFA
MENSLEVLGTAATASSVLCQLVGLQICVQIVRKGGTDLMSPVPFITFFVSACLWLKYGLLQKNSNLVMTNCASALLQLLYIFVFYAYTVKKSHFHRLLLVASIILFSPLLYLHFVQRDVSKGAYHLGLMCCCLSVCCYASPMATVRDVCRTKSVESISFLLVLSNFASAVCWCWYGVLLHDSFVMMPNGLGVLFGFVQLTLFCCYPSKRQRQKTVHPTLLET